MNDCRLTIETVLFLSLRGALRQVVSEPAGLPGINHATRQSDLNKVFLKKQFFYEITATPRNLHGKAVV